MIDYHVHTKLCKHAVGEMREYVEEALKKGLSKMGFSDHLPFNETHMKDLSMSPKELEFYVAEIESIKKEFNLEILCGIEADYYPERQDEIVGFLNKYDFDYVYGSAHYINGWAFDNPKFITEWDKYNVDDVYKAYYETLKELVKSGFYDIVAHFDLVKKFGFAPKRSFFDEINEIMSLIKKQNMMIEVNTSGLRKPAKEIYPSRAIIEIAKSFDVPVILGSDAHKPEDVAKDFDAALDLLREVGYSEIPILKKRKIKCGKTGIKLNFSVIVGKKLRL